MYSMISSSARELLANYCGIREINHCGKFCFRKTFHIAVVKQITSLMNIKQAVMCFTLFIS